MRFAGARGTGLVLDREDHLQATENIALVAVLLSPRACLCRKVDARAGSRHRIREDAFAKVNH